MEFLFLRPAYLAETTQDFRVPDNMAHSDLQICTVCLNGKRYIGGPK
jgi:hypothetical protein